MTPEKIQTSQLVFAFGLTLLAGLCTGIGSVMAFFARRTNTRFLSAALGFSAGVMIYVSLIEIFQKSRFALEQSLGARTGYWATVGAFFAGIALVALIDKLVPSFENPHELPTAERYGEHHLCAYGLVAVMALSLLLFA